MPEAFLILLFFQLTGTLLSSLLHIPVPGPVTGMFLLAAVLIRRQSRERPPAAGLPGGASISAGAGTDAAKLLSRTLVASLGLLFVPAGVGIVSQHSIVIANALPIAVALVVSTLSGLVVTALVMHWMTRDGQAPDLLPDDGGQVL